MPGLEFKQLEYHVADACNMACDYCSHYSNFKGPANLLDHQTIIDEWTPWAKEISPKRFHIIGGEPLLNPQICKIVESAFSVWSSSLICLYSNGLLIDRYPLLKKVLAGGRFAFGLHYCDERDAEILANVKSFFHGTGVAVDVIDGNQGWLRHYRFNEDEKPIPFNDDNPRSSWENCVGRFCHVLRNNRLWKCPQVAFADRAGIDWFESYRSCSLDDDIAKWQSKEDEECCGNCPATKQFTSHGADWMRRRLPIITR